MICSSGHEKIARVDMHHRVLGISQNQALKVKECQIIISNQICTLSAVYVGLLEGLIEVKGYREILHGLRQDTEASISTTTCEIELGRGFLL